MKRNNFLLLSVIGIFTLMTGCKSQEPVQTDAGTETQAGEQTIELTVWGAEEDEALLQEIFASFKERYRGEADFQITYQAQSESNCKDVLLGDLENGADVFAFADDQVAALAAAGALDPIEDDAGIRSENLSAAVDEIGRAHV